MTNPHDKASENLQSLFAKHSTPDFMQPLYIAAVALIETHSKNYPLLGKEQS